DEFVVGKDSSPKNIVAAGDGSLWFTDLGTNKVGRITVTGRVTERSVGGGYRQLEGLAAGDGRTVWLAETHANTVARLALGSRRPGDVDGVVALDRAPAFRAAVGP